MSTVFDAATSPPVSKSLFSLPEETSLKKSSGVKVLFPEWEIRNSSSKRKMIKSQVTYFRLKKHIEICTDAFLVEN